MGIHSSQIINPSLNLIRYTEAENVSYNTLTTILTFTASQDTLISLIVCSGEDYAKFQLFINTDLVATKRSGNKRNVEWSFPNSLLLRNGEILDVKVTHYFTGDVLDFEAGLYANTQT